MIKQFEPSQIDTVMKVWLKTTITAHSFIPEQYWIENYDIVRNEYMPMSTIFIYEEDDTIKAFISIIENTFVENPFIGALFVLKDYERQGIGTKLLNYCKSLYSSLELGVYIANISAVNFYKHGGFTVKTEQPNEDSGYKEYTMIWTKQT